MILSMKRPLVLTLIIGFAVAFVMWALHGFGVLARLEEPVAGFISHFWSISHPVAGGWQYLIITFVSLGMAGLTLTTNRRIRMAWIAGALILELLVLAWICALHQVLFQPLPSIFAVALAFIAAERTLAIMTHSRSTLAQTLFAGRLSGEQM